MKRAETAHEDSSTQQTVSHIITWFGGLFLIEFYVLGLLAEHNPMIPGPTCTHNLVFPGPTREHNPVFPGPTFGA